MVGPTPEKMLDPTYFSFQILEAQYIKLTNSVGYNVTYTPIDYEFCGSKFPYSNKSIYDRIGISTYVCPKNTNFYVRANLNSGNYAAIQISLTKCSGSNCQSNDTINSVLNSYYISIKMISAYFDFNDYSNPVKTYLQEANFVFLIQNFSSIYRFRVQLNEVSTNHNLFLGSQGPTDSYIQ